MAALIARERLQGRPATFTPLSLAEKLPMPLSEYQHTHAHCSCRVRCEKRLLHELAQRSLPQFDMTLCAVLPVLSCRGVHCIFAAVLEIAPFVPAHKFDDAGPQPGGRIERF